MTIIDLTGRTFGRLTVKHRSSNRSNNDSLWLCHCSCGVEKDVRSKLLRYGKARSCGCLRSETTLVMNKTHGEASARNKTKEYMIWQSMKSRCFNSRSHAYIHYGGRGIKVCERWMTYSNFLSDMGRKPNNHSLDRINNNGDYEPSNCRWATRKEQVRNRRIKRLDQFSDKEIFSEALIRMLRINEGRL